MREGWRASTEETLHLTFRVREGVEGCVDRETPPPSHISSEGGGEGVCRQGNTPSVSHFK